MKEEIKQTYIVCGKTFETPSISTIKLTLLKGDVAKYIPGQFLTVYFPELGTPEGKAYSISSAPCEKEISLSVKAIGEFSNRLVGLKSGDTITTSMPCGYFYSESEETSLVMIAAGIGIAPFRSMIIDILKRKSERKIFLFYSNKTMDEIVFRTHFDELSARFNNFKVVYFITREKNSADGMVAGRISAVNILEKIRGVTNVEFLICGSISFTRDLWRELRGVGVSEDMIYTEAFFSH